MRSTPLLDPLPGFLQWYIRPTAGRNNFTFFPWSGFVFAGALAGVVIDRTRGVSAERTLHTWMAPASLAFAAACYAGSYLPSIYADSRFWTSSPMFFLLRVGIVTSTLSVVYFWELRPRLLGARGKWAAPMVVFGHSSLFVYWVHGRPAWSSERTRGPRDGSGGARTRESGRIAVASPSGPIILTVDLTRIGEGRVPVLACGRPLDSVALLIPARRGRRSPATP